MALPSTAITRTELGATFSEFDLAASRAGFIGARVLRPRAVGVQAADVGKIPIEALLVTKDDTRAPGAGYRRGDFEFTKFSYATDEHGWEEPMDDRTLAMYADLLDAESIHTQRAMDMVLRNYEIAAAAAVYDTAVWTGAALTLAITEEWDTAASAVPISDVAYAKQKIRANSGLEPNALICNRKQFEGICASAQVIDRIKYWGGDDPKNITEQMIAALLGLDYILVAGGIKSTAKEGQSAVLAACWSDEYAMVARVAVTDDPQEPCVGRTFMWTGDSATGAAGPGGGELALTVEEYREESVRGSVIRARNDRDIVVMYPEAAFLFSNAITI